MAEEDPATNADLKAELFGDSESEDEDYVADDKRLRVADLAARKRRELEEQAAQDGSGPERKRARKGPPSGEPAGTAAAAGAEEAGAAEDEEEDDDAEQVATAEDAAFIDDEGVPEASASDGEEAEAVQHEEAEEVGEEDELQKIFSKKGRQRRESTSLEDRKLFIDSFLSKMESAAEVDFQESQAGKPALNKLSNLAELDDVLRRKNLQGDLLDAGVLGVLKAWLEPMADGCLPNVAIRTTILQVLDLMPLDMADGRRREQLKRSGLGPVIMFLKRVPDESAANRRAADALIRKWSRQVVAELRSDDGEAAEAERERQLQHIRSARERAAGQAGVRSQDAAQQKLKPGDPGYRWHASIPEASRLDYVNRPQSKVAADAAAQRNKPAKMDKMGRRLKVLNQKKAAGGRAARVSVEGRGLLI